MTKKMDWRTARLSSKRSTSITDEKEYRDRDAAARFIEKRSQPAKDATPQKHKPKGGKR